MDHRPTVSASPVVTRLAVAALAPVLLLAGCQSAGPVRSRAAAAEPSDTSTPPSAAREDVVTRGPVDVQRPDVLWADGGAAPDTEPAPDAPHAAGPGATPPTAPITHALHMPDTPSAVAASRDAVLREAMANLTDVEAESFRLALDRAALAASLGQERLTDADLNGLGLDPRGRRVVEAYHALLLRVNRELVAAPTEFDPRAVLDGFADATGQTGVRIADLRLCAAVRGFGQYDELPIDRLLAGRRHAMVLYTELDGFSPHATPDGRYETRVSQEVRLYHATDDLLVWERPAEVLADLSNNRRRDFFMVQPIELPASVGVGRYRLKVSVIDHHSDTMWEQTIPIEVVADEALVHSPNKSR